DRCRRRLLILLILQLLEQFGKEHLLGRIDLLRRAAVQPPQKLLELMLKLGVLPLGALQLLDELLDHRMRCGQVERKRGSTTNSGIFHDGRHYSEPAAPAREESPRFAVDNSAFSRPLYRAG